MNKPCREEIKANNLFNFDKDSCPLINPETSSLSLTDDNCCYCPYSLYGNDCLEKLNEQGEVWSNERHRQ